MDHMAAKMDAQLDGAQQMDICDLLQAATPLGNGTGRVSLHPQVCADAVTEITALRTQVQAPAIEQLLAALQLDRAPTDGDRAKVLGALMAYSRAIGNPALEHAAKQRFPAANPFTPPDAWAAHYREWFGTFADEDELDVEMDVDRYCQEYWQGLTDAQRTQRLAKPELGQADGRKDAEALNAA